MGFSLVELLVVMAIFSIVAMAVVTSLLSAQRTWSTGSGQAVLTAELRRALDRMSHELVESKLSEVQQLPLDGRWSQAITFRVPQDRSVPPDGSVLDTKGDIAEWSDPIRYQRGARNACQRLEGTRLPETLANHMTDVRFRHVIVTDPQTRLPTPTGVIEIQLTTSTITETGQVMSRTMGTRVKLRNG